MSVPEYREARTEDLPKAVDLYLVAVGDLLRRNGVDASVLPRAPMEMAYTHIHATGIFRVAEASGRIVAIAAAIVRDTTWFLSAFWVEPGLQRKGIGMPLLRRVWEAGRDGGASSFFTWSSVDPTAIAAYMKLEMMPGFPILNFEGEPRGLTEVARGYTAVDLRSEVAMDLDREVRGTPRPQDHEFWRRRASLRGSQVELHGRPVGYYYVAPSGTIGPVAWGEDSAAEPLLALASRDAAALAPVIRLAVPGVNHAAVRFALATGLRLTHYAHFMTSAPFGKMERYLPSGPSMY